MKCAALCLLIASWLTAHGYDPPHQRAMLHSIWIESRFDSCVTRGPRGSAYLLQWLGPRRRALERFAGSVGCPLWQTQMEFATQELRTLPRYQGFWNVSTEAVAFWELREHFGRGR